jgi:hypothetical protein
LGRAGELNKRTGFEQLNNGSTLGPNPVKLIGHYYSGAYSQIIARIGTNIYYSNDGINWTSIGTYAVEFGIQYADTFYMVRKGGTVLAWTGTGTPTSITGSPGGDFCIVHKERLFVLDSSGTGQPNSRMYFSRAGDVTATGWISTNFNDYNTGDGDFLTCGIIVHDLLVVFKTRTTWGLYVQGTSSGDWVIRSLNPRIGCVSKYTPKNIDGIIHFVAATGIYRTDGTSFKCISDSLLPVLKDRVVNITNANIDQAVYWNDIYLVMVQPQPNVIKYYAYYLKMDGWTEWQIAGGYFPAYFLEIRAATPVPGVYAGDFNPTGNSFRYGKNIYTDINLPYPSSIQTKDFDFGLDGANKRGRWMIMDTKGAATLNSTHVVNSVDAATYSVTSDVLSKVQKTSGPGYFRTWSYKLSVISSNAFSLFGIVLYYQRKGKVIGANV